MYFVIMGSETGPVGEPSFFTDRDAAADAASAMAHSPECPVPGAAFVGESTATTMTELEALPDREVTVFGCLNRVSESAVGAANIPGWLWAAEMRRGATKAVPDNQVSGL